MHPVALIDAIALLGWLLAVVAVLVRWRTGLARHARAAFLVVALLSLINGGCMFLEWSGITPALERLEDIVGATLPVWWAFAIYVVVEGMDRDSLRRGRERYALAQKAASIGSWDWNILTGDLSWSEQIEPMFGLAPGQFGRTYEAFLGYVHPDDRGYVDDSVSAALEKGDSYDIEHRIVWPDGSVRWVSEAGEVLRDEHGTAVRMLGIVRDITEGKRVEERLIAQAETERLLRRELDHRVRNNLSSLISLIGLSRAGAKSINEFAEAVENRARVIASVHSILAAGKWHGSDLKTMLETLIQSGRGAMIVYEGPAVTVPPVQAQAVGFIINELAMNSVKYGAMSCEDGVVRIEWDVVASDDGSHEVNLRWDESGGPPIEEVPSPGVGSSLVEGLAQSELRGSAELSYTHEGVSHTLHLRLEESGTAQFGPAAAAAINVR